MNKLTPMSAVRPRHPNYPSRSSHSATSFLACLLAAIVAFGGTAAGASDSPRIKRISLMTSDLDQSIAFFTEVIGLTLDFKGTLPPKAEPFLGPVFNIDSNAPIRRALLSTATEPRGLFLIEHAGVRAKSIDSPRDVVTVIQVQSVETTINRAKRYGSTTSEIERDETPEGVQFAEALIMSPGGHAILVYEYMPQHRPQDEQPPL